MVILGTQRDHKAGRGNRRGIISVTPLAQTVLRPLIFFNKTT